MKKSLAFVSFFIGGSLSLFLLSLWGCNKREHTILFKDIDASIVQYEPNGLETPLVENDTCSYSTSFIKGSFAITQLSFNSKALPGNQAFAFQPGSSYYKPVEKISAIRIISLKKYNNSYLAGSDITNACRFVLAGVYSKMGDSSVTALVEDLNVGYSDERFDLHPYLQIYLSEKPDILSAQQFAIELKTELNALIRDTTIIFYLKP